MNKEQARYWPAPGYWRQSPRHQVLWATLGVLDYVERQGPEDRALRPFLTRLRRLLSSIASSELLARLWRAAGSGQKAPEEGAEAAETEVDLAVSAIVAAFFEEIDALRALAAEKVGRGLPPELKEKAIQEAYALVRRVPETLKEEMRQMMRETLAAHKTQFDFARALRRKWEEFSRYRAEMIARTEWARVAGRATLELYKQQGVPRKIWFTVGDLFVCEICRKNAEKGPIPLTDNFPGNVDTVPQHPHCRCNIAGSL